MFHDEKSQLSHLTHVNLNKLKTKVEDKVEHVMRKLTRSTISYMPYDWRSIFDGKAFKRTLTKVEALYGLNKKVYFDFHKMTSSSHSFDIENSIVET